MAKAKQKDTVIKLTETGTTVTHVRKFAAGTPQAAMVQALLPEWVKTHARVANSKSTIAHAFAEVYCPEYNDEASGDLTIALDRAMSPETKPKAVPAKPKAKAVVEKKAPAKKAAAKVKSATAKVSKAEQVREMIRANPKADVDALIVMAIDTLGMAGGKAKTYVKENVERVRG